MISLTLPGGGFFSPPAPPAPPPLPPVVAEKNPVTRLPEPDNAAARRRRGVADTASGRATTILSQVGESEKLG